jgi:valyl-tRNA synthetase
MEKTYQPDAIERSNYPFWENNGYFKPQELEKTKGKISHFCTMLPPPNVTGTLHMGHGFEHTLMDILTRYHRMMGDNTLWQGGTDHAGIATQMVVERLLESEGSSRIALGRESFLKRVWDWKEESGNIICKQMRRMGTSPDWSRDKFTMDEGLSVGVKTAFIKLYEEGLIYRGERLVNWDSKLQTALSDLEVISEEEEGKLWHIQYSEEMPEIIVATTRPETLLGDTAIAVHPEDPRYRHLIGKMIKVPLTHREIPIIADTYVDPAFGSGCVKITPAHDFNDYEIGKRHNLPLINIFTETGLLNSNTPKDYQGLNREAAREKILKELNLTEIKPHKLKIPRSDRSGVIVEPRITTQWYVKMESMAKAGIEAVTSGDIKFYPENATNTYFEWLNNIQDWCISRQLWWGHRIPAFYDSTGKVYVGESVDQVRQKYGLDQNILLTQDEDVLDTWFSSALWPFSTLGWPEKTPELETFYPTNVLVTGFDLIFFWVARMIMFGLKFTGQAPFKHVYFHGIIRDHEGKKMSKSKGNVLDPVDLIDGIDLDALLKKRTYGMMQPRLKEAVVKATQSQFPAGITAYGCDALRFTFAALASTSRDINFDMQRMEGYRNFCNKIWNAARFVLMNIAPDAEAGGQSYDPGAPKTFSNIDHWIWTKLNKTISACHEAIAEYRFDHLAQHIYEFIWNDYCDWYLELAKVVLYDTNATAEQKNGTKFTLINILETALRLAHPIIPFITEEIWQTLKTYLNAPHRSLETIMLCPYPTASENAENSDTEGMVWVQKLIMTIRTLRSESQISPAKKIKVFLQNPSEQETRLLGLYTPWIENLCRLESLVISSSEESQNVKNSSSKLLETLKIIIPLDGLIDVVAEKARLEKIQTKLLDEVARLKIKLGNEKFTQSAPAEVVRKEQQKLDEAERSCEEVSMKIKSLL